MRIAFVFPCGHFLSTPCLVSLVKLLAANGVHVDLYTASNESSFCEGGFSELAGDHVRVFLYPLRMQGYYENIPRLMLGFAFWYEAQKAATRYDLTIAAGIRGLFLQGIDHLFRREPFIYLSLEMYFRDEKPGLKGRAFKALESLFNKSAALTLIQDELRAAILARENRLDGHPLAVFPNSALRQAFHPNSPGLAKMAAQLGFPGKKIALYPGSIFDRWALGRELVEAAADWPDDWLLLIHSKARLPIAPKLLPSNNLQESNKIRFSNEPLSGKDYDNLVAASDVGIALYDAGVSKNFYYLGYSSGKISDFLRFGKPVIVSDLPKLRDLVLDNQCGVVVREVGEISRALATIAADYERYSENASRTFNQFLDPERYIDDLLVSMREICHQHPKN